METDDQNEIDAYYQELVAAVTNEGDDSTEELINKLHQEFYEDPTKDEFGFITDGIKKKWQLNNYKLDLIKINHELKGGKSLDEELKDEFQEFNARLKSDNLIVLEKEIAENINAYKLQRVKASRSYEEPIKSYVILQCDTKIEFYEELYNIVHEKILNDNKYQGLEITGFDCNLPIEIKQTIFYQLIQLDYIETDLLTFINAFTKAKFLLAKKIIWKISSERGKRSHQGNRTALKEFLKIMLRDNYNSSISNTVKLVFVDKEGNEMSINKDSKSSNIGFTWLSKIINPPAESVDTE